MVCYYHGCFGNNYNLFHVNTKEKHSDFFTNENLWFPGAKVWADRSPYVGSMATKEPYLDTEMTRVRALDFDEKNYPCGYLIYKCAEDQAKVLYTGF